MVAAARAQLEARRQEVNDLNAFPVADGDTGDNMAQTLRAVMEELDRLNGQPVDKVGRDVIVKAVARAALLGARGNSGVILSQVVRGAAATSPTRSRTPRSRTCWSGRSRPPRSRSSVAPSCSRCCASTASWTPAATA